MSDSDTYLDSILEGLTAGEAPQQTTGKLPTSAPPEDANGTTAQPANVPSDTEEPPSEAPPQANSLDNLLEGLTTPPAPADPDGGAPEPAIGDLTEVDPDVLIGTGDLDLATPQDILGVPSEPGVVSSHIDLAQEINDVATPTTTETHGARERWESNHSFAAIARDISATVEVNPASSSRTRSGGKSGDDEHPSFYVRTRRRRRKRRMNTVTIGQVIGLLLLLVLGLAGEYEYVSKHSGSPIVVTPLATSPKIPTVAQTRVPGALFHFATLGTADSAPFVVRSRFAIEWSARCARPSDVTGVVMTLKSTYRIATAIDVPLSTAAPKSGVTAVIAPGAYTLYTHASSGCSWTVTGQARA
jgi:hypothetical protein